VACPGRQMIEACPCRKLPSRQKIFDPDPRARVEILTHEAVGNDKLGDEQTEYVCLRFKHRAPCARNVAKAAGKRWKSKIGKTQWIGAQFCIWWVAHSRLKTV